GRRDDCSDRIAVRFSGAAEYEIIEPIRIQLTETDGRAAFQSVVVEAENGVTILTFSSRAARGMVERTGFAVMKLGRFAGAKGVFTALRDGPMGLA
ncbi:MAG TPA: hypothetical protein VK327_03945, partial [Candidatus Paceibacterota bacterium]|nr:hypothetical protein [Candidatus Paceibacterota bacterium]